MIETITLNGLKLRVCTKGCGPALLLLHGWGGCIESVYRLVEDLSVYAFVICPDLPGFGQSESPQSVWGVKDYSFLCEQLLNYYGLARAHIVGHSFGGRIALYLGAYRPQRVLRLVLLAGAGVKPRRGFRYYFRKIRYRLAKFFYCCKCNPAFPFKQYGSPEYRALSGVMRQTFCRVVGEDLTPVLPYVKGATLLIYGGRDRDTPLYMARILKKKLPCSTLIIHKNCGHFAYLEERMQILYECVRFLFYADMGGKS